MSNSHSNVNEEPIKMSWSSLGIRWNNFTVVYLLLGFIVLLFSSLIYGLENGKMMFAAMIAIGVSLMVLGYISDYVSYRRGDYNYKTPGQIQ